GLARPRRSVHDQSLRRNQYEDQAGGTPGQRAFGYYGGMPHQANLENRRIPPELAGVALIVMWPESAAVSGFQLRNPAPSWRRPHNPVGHRRVIMCPGT